MKIFQGALVLALRVAAVSLPWHTVVVQAADDGIQVHATFERPADNVFDGSGEVRHIVCPGNGIGRAAALQSASKFHLETKQGCMALTMPPARAAALAKNKNIDLVEIDQKRYPMGVASGPGLRGGGDAGSFRKRPSSGDGRRLAESAPYGIAAVQADQVTMGSTSVMVCIIDSGYDYGHEDLPTADVTFDSSSPGADTDLCSHGTHVAGTIAAVNNNVGVIGVAPGADLHIVKVFGNDEPGNCGWSYSSNLIDALDACVMAGAKIVSMSLGCSGGPGGGPFACQSSAEKRAFDQAYDRGVLSIAAAGNDGNTALSYPASYTSVVSVAATNSSDGIAGFSQQNEQVELAAPGVDVLSTVLRGSGTDVSVMIDGAGYSALGMDGSPFGMGSGQLINCGLGLPGDCSGATGMVCLIQRGDITFAEKVVECEAGGGVAAVIYNNVAGPLSGATLGEDTTGLNLVPAVGVSKADGATLLDKIGTNAVIVVERSDYALYDGTSMATPHVSGVAALVWSHCSACGAADIRQALRDSAKPLGATVPDNVYGYGLVQAKAALDTLEKYNCWNSAVCTTTSLGPPPSNTPSPTTAPTSAPTAGPMAPGTPSPTTAPTSAPTAAPMAPSTPSPTAAPTSAPTAGPASQCTLASPGDSCTVDDDCCSNKCKGKPGDKTCN